MSKSSTISIIDQSMQIKGDVISNGAIDIIGSLVGRIIANQLITKQNSNVSGDIFVADMMVCEGGKIGGNIIANNIRLTKNTNIEGVIRYNKISIEDGAIINGDIKKIDATEIKSMIDKVLQDANVIVTDNDNSELS